MLTSMFVGSCITAGNLVDGFKNTFSEYLIASLSDTGHCYIILFLLFLSGLIRLMEKSGGMLGFTKLCSSFVTNQRTAQLTCFVIGVLLFFDDSISTLLAGQTMKPIFDTMMLSREKLSFIIDATALPVVSLSPISSWIGFEIAVIQPELDRIIQIMGTDDIGIKTSGLGVFIQSIQYQYYSFYMIAWVLLLIVLRRDFGPMLYAERKVTIYERTDGGDGKETASDKMDDNSDDQPNKGAPLRAYNMLIPLAILVRT
jgi:Na+/H+ antiporter NhaC